MFTYVILNKFACYFSTYCLTFIYKLVKYSTAIFGMFNFVKIKRKKYHKTLFLLISIFIRDVFLVSHGPDKTNSV